MGQRSKIGAVNQMSNMASVLDSIFRRNDCEFEMKKNSTQKMVVFGRKHIKSEC